jgi:hypothetical protein
MQALYSHSVQSKYKGGHGLTDVTTEMNLNTKRGGNRSAEAQVFQLARERDAMRSGTKEPAGVIL